jgi:hypothetical protein
MGLQPSLTLRVVDGFELDGSRREALRPAEYAQDRQGKVRRLPRYFYEVTSWREALDTQLTPHFGLWELLDVDFRESPSVRRFPRYVPCAISLLAAQLETLRTRVGTVVRIAANGGYRSPGHAGSSVASPHMWGAAADIYRIGDELMDSRERIEKYIRVARDVLPGIWTRPFGEGPGFAFDHVHVDLGFVTVVPHDAADEDGMGQ